MRRIAFLVLLLPAVALAQSAPPSPSPSDPSQSPSDPTPDPTVSTAPGATAPTNPPQPADDASTMLPNPADPAGAPDGYRRLQTSPTYPPPRGYNLPTAADEKYTPPVQPHEGRTLEAGLGLGWQHAADADAEPTTQLGVPSFSVGVGAWLGRPVAISARLSTLAADPDASSGLRVHSFLGPALQIWLTDSIWFGGGGGLEFLTKTNDRDTVTNLGFEARAGYTFNPNSKHSINASIEVLSATFASHSSSIHFTGRMTSVGVLLGYQLL